MKFLVYSAGTGLIAGAFLLFIVQGKNVSTDVEAPIAHPLPANVHFVKIPLVTYPVELKCAPE